MSEEDKLFNFLSGLQTWAQTELRCQGVKDLPSAIAAADQLVDFRVANSSNLEKKKKDYGKENEKSGNGWKDGKFKKRSTRRNDHPNRRVQINGKAVMTMLDLGATQNFVADREIQKLGLTLTQHSSHVKAVNLAA
ncbi:UNVERIFIED_CONTAM: hypothetical protein Sangu_3113600 [Sesamum angustifolium]|uniref:Gag-pol polyprotein n=1 Tax=Sesamum angustifolium TaxID=2727405 RepID=A0AAW2K8K8_9LAMI